MTPPEPSDAASAPSEAAAPPDLRRRRGWIVASVVIGVLAVGGTTAAFMIPAIAPPAAEEQTSLAPRATGEVSRGDVSERVKASGQLAFGAAKDIGTSLPGTITSIPAPGTIVDRGGELFRVDDRPVTLLFGKIPVWRAFAPGMENGRDVRQLEENLRELGFFSREPDDDFTWRTAEAIRDWKQSRGLERTGELPLGSIVFESGPIRIAKATGVVGGPSGGSVVSVTGTAKLITVDLDPNLAAGAAVGASVDVTLPGGAKTTATVVSAGAPVERDSSGSTVLRIPLVLTLDDPDATGDFVDVQVPVVFVRTLATDILRVPVTALLAGPDGTTELEVISGAKTKSVSVTLGAFGDGLVEVTGDGLAEGDIVAVAE